MAAFLGDRGLRGEAAALANIALLLGDVESQRKSRRVAA